MSCDDSRAQQEEERLLFPGKDLANEKPWTLFCFVLFCFVLFFTISLPTSFRPLKKHSPYPAVGGLVQGSPWLQTLNCNFLLILNKPIFAEEISGSLFVSGQQRLHLKHFKIEV